MNKRGLSFVVIVLIIIVLVLVGVLLINSAVVNLSPREGGSLRENSDFLKDNSRTDCEIAFETLDRIRSTGNVRTNDVDKIERCSDFSEYSKVFGGSGSCSNPDADINGDGVVDVADLIIVIFNWDGSGEGDVNSDGVVDVSDLIEVLFNWGECESFIEVCTGEDLDNVRNNLEGNYKQVCDIDLAGFNFEPIDFFTGIFNGDNHVISNFEYLGEGERFGLFGTTFEAEIINVNLVNVSVGGDERIGGLVGLANGGSIENSYVEGVVQGNERVGLLVGHNSQGTIISSSSEGVVRGNERVGGLVGEHSGSISDSYFNGEVLIIFDESDPISRYVGGLVGRFSEGDVINSSAIGFIDNQGNQAVWVGGFIGDIVGFGDEGDFVILDSNADVDIFGTVDKINDLGGFIGRISGVTIVSISNSYAKGDIDLEEGNRAGGFVGFVAGVDNVIIEDSYAKGDLEVDCDFIGCGNNFGGFAGKLSADEFENITIRNSYSLGNITAKASVGGFVGTLLNSYVMESYSKGDVYGLGVAGGFVGDLVGMSSINDSYARGDSSGVNAIGGFVGSYTLLTTDDCQEGFCVWRPKLNNVYSTGKVTAEFPELAGGLVGFSSVIPGENIISSYWNIETSGQNESAGGEGRTTEEMIMYSNNTYVNWDFENVWQELIENYPWLEWQGEPN